MNDKKNILIVLEERKISFYSLDEKKTWNVGRPSNGSDPDIKINSALVSRNHGKFKNLDGFWFYLDNNGKNGTIYNDLRIASGISGRVRPVMMDDGDIFIFGNGSSRNVNNKTSWAIYLSDGYEDMENCRIVDTSEKKTLIFNDGSNETKISDPNMGTVVRQNNGMAIYMGNITYLIGEIDIIGIE